MSRVTRSSSENGISDAAPGVSRTGTRRPRDVIAPSATSTVVPG
jgi:hypothetical protein